MLSLQAIHGVRRWCIPVILEDRRLRIGDGQSCRGRMQERYVVGDSQSMSYTDNFPVVNAVSPNYGGLSGCLRVEVNPTGMALVYSTYLGGIDSTRVRRDCP